MLKNVKQPIRMLKNVQGPIRMPKMRITLYFAEKFDYIPDPVHKKSSTWISRLGFLALRMSWRIASRLTAEVVSTPTPTDGTLWSGADAADDEDEDAADARDRAATSGKTEIPRWSSSGDACEETIKN